MNMNRVMNWSFIGPDKTLTLLADFSVEQWRRFIVMSGGGGAKCRGNEEVRMPLLSGTDIFG